LFRLFLYKEDLDGSQSINTGAGYAGIEAALTLHKKKRKKDDIEITLSTKILITLFLQNSMKSRENRITEDAVIVPFKRYLCIYGCKNR